MKRYDLLNLLINRHGYRRYLEIGVRHGETFNRVVAKHKASVDPEWPATYNLTSDAFFAAVEKGTTYDLIFIDGLHLAEQVERDILNSLVHLAPGGAIVVHDCNPLTEDAQSDDYDGVKAWNGTVWKAWTRLRTRADLDMCVVDTDEGCGVITYGDCGVIPHRAVGSLVLREPVRTELDTMDYAYLERNRRKLLNLIPVDWFL